MDPKRIIELKNGAPSVEGEAQALAALYLAERGPVTMHIDGTVTIGDRTGIAGPLVYEKTNANLR